MGSQPTESKKTSGVSGALSLKLAVRSKEGRELQRRHVSQNYLTDLLFVLKSAGNWNLNSAPNADVINALMALKEQSGLST
jgi:hypothetical protein